MVLATHSWIIYLVVINKRARCMSKRELIAWNDNDNDKQQLYCGNNSKNGVDYSPDEARLVQNYCIYFYNGSSQQFSSFLLSPVLPIPRLLLLMPLHYAASFIPFDGFRLIKLYFSLSFTDLFCCFNAITLSLLSCYSRYYRGSLSSECARHRLSKNGSLVNKQTNCCWYFENLPFFFHLKYRMILLFVFVSVCLITCL